MMISVCHRNRDSCRVFNERKLTFPQCPVEVLSNLTFNILSNGTVRRLFDGSKKKENEVNRNVEAPFLAGGPQFWERAKRCKTPVAQSAAQFKCDFN